MAPQASPCTNYLSPRRVTRRSLALAQTPNHTTASPAKPAHTPAQFCLTLDQTPAQAPKSQRGTPKSTQTRKDPVKVSLCFTPLREDPSDAIKPVASPEHQSETVVSQESTATPLPSIPTITIVEEQEEAVRDDFALSLCETPLPVSKAPEPPCSLSFTISPCGAPSPPPNSSPAAVEAQESVCHSADSSVLEVKTCFTHFSLHHRLFLNCTDSHVVPVTCRRIKSWTLSAISSRHLSAAPHRGR